MLSTRILLSAEGAAGHARANQVSMLRRTQAQDRAEAETVHVSAEQERSHVLALCALVTPLASP